MTRSAVSWLTRPRVSTLSARETVPGCTWAARATSRSVTEDERTAPLCRRLQPPGRAKASERLRAQACATHGRVPAQSLDRRAMAVLSLGHLCVDLCQGALPALLAFLIAAHHWSYGQASALVLAATISSSIIQPLFGHLSDGRS